VRTLLSAVRSAWSARSSLSWPAADQALSSLTNYGMLLLGLVLLDVQQFGVLSLGLVTYALLVGMVRATAGEPYMLIHGQLASGSVVSLQAGGPMALGLGIGALASAITLGLLPMVPATERMFLVVMALILPALLLQDVQRYVLITSDRGRSAFVSDATWLLGLGVGAIWLLSDASHTVGAVHVAAVWGFGGIAAAIAAHVMIRVLPHGLIDWVRSSKHFGKRLFLEQMLGNGAMQASNYVVAGLIGISSFGLLRQGLTLLGPLNTLYAAIALSVVPAALRRGGSRHLARRAAGASGIVLITLTLLWIAILIVYWPQLQMLLRIENPGSLRTLLLPLGIFFVAGAVTGATVVALRILRDVQASLRARTWSAGAVLAGSTIGALTGTASGAAYGLASGATLGMVIWLAITGRRLNA
jgi:O-antigen/teichoic acid export membrane protein